MLSCSVIAAGSGEGYGINRGRGDLFSKFN